MKGSTLAAALVGGIMVVSLGGGAAVYVLARRGGGGAYVPRPHQHFVALDGARAVAWSGGVGAPLEVRGVERRGDALAVRWRWQGPSNGDAHPWMWARRGSLAAGEFHAVQGDGPSRVLVFDHGRGLAGAVEAAERGAFAFLDDRTVAAVAADGLRLLDVTRPDATWQAPVPAGRFAPHVAGSARHAVVWNGALLAYDRAAPAAPRVIGPLTDVVGVAAARDEALVLADGAVSVRSLADGAERVRLDLAGGGPVADGLDDPCLLGRHGDLWLVLYAAAGDRVVSVNSLTWTEHSPRTLAGVDMASGAVRWRAELGPWAYRCVDEPFRLELPTDRELPSPLVLHGVADVPNERGLRGNLVLVDAATGAVRWRAPYDGASRGGTFWSREGATVTARLGEAPRDAVLRFDGGRLTGAVALAGTSDALAAPAVAADGAWVGGEAWLHLAAPDLRPDGGDGDRGAARDVRAEAGARFGLPAEAR